jgi:predicted lactoylglutathione lyase
MAKKIKDDVKEHLRKRDIPESKLTDEVIDALNVFSKEELDHLDRVDKLGAALMDDGMLNDKQKISAVH